MTTIEWRDGTVRFLDQTRLPEQEVLVDTDDYRVVADAIRTLRIRGAPLIGIAAAYAAALAARRTPAGEPPDPRLKRALARLGATRPTAVNLFHALDRVRAALPPGGDRDAIAAAALGAARELHREDERMCRAIGAHGSALVPDGAAIVTHCNAGALATGGIGTALGIITTAAAAGKAPTVFADETRPLLQGSRLTAWELERAGIPVTLLPDGAAAWLMASRRIDLVLIGADRIAANGDTANKVGSYGLALAAAAHNVPFYVAAPSSTIDPSLPSGDGIPIEERGAEELTEWGGVRVAPRGAGAWTPAFDVTPARLIAAIVTERGVHRPPYRFGASAGGPTPEER